MKWKASYVYFGAMLLIMLFWLLSALMAYAQAPPGVVAVAPPRVVEESPVDIGSIRGDLNAILADIEELRTLCAAQGDGKKPPPQKFFRGAKRTPLHKILKALASGQATVHQPTKAPNGQATWLATKLSMWGNSQEGDCVTAEFCAAIAGYSSGVLGKDKEVFVTEQAAMQWAAAHGFANGANLLDVITAMQSDGITDENGVLRKGGAPSTVDYTSETAIQTALDIGPLSIAIDANALPSGAGNATGWTAFGGKPGQFGNTDHCVDVAAYGTKEVLAQWLGIPVPTDAPAGTLYAIFTWKTYGIADYAWIMSTIAESWLRTPTVVGLGPGPGPGPGPTPTPTPTGGSLTIKFDGTGTSLDGQTMTFTAAPQSITITMTHNADGTWTLTPVSPPGKALPKKGAK